MRSLVGWLFFFLHATLVFICQDERETSVFAKVQWQSAAGHGQGIIWVSWLEFPDILLLSFEVLKISLSGGNISVSILSKQLRAKAKTEKRRWQTWSVFSQCKGQEGRRALGGACSRAERGGRTTPEGRPVSLSQLVPRWWCRRRPCGKGSASTS